MKHTNPRAARPWTLLLLVAMVALISLGCSDSNPTTGGNVNPLGAYTTTNPTGQSVTNGTTQGVGQIDTPIVSVPQDTDGRRDHTNAPLLDNWHPGWQQVSCFSCHTDQSRIPDHSYANTDLCYLCHGTNGLPGFGDNIPPIIKGVVVNQANTTVTISWKTDEPCICRLIIRTKEGDKMEFPVGSEYAESHKYIVSGLLPESTYTYEIRATDRNSNLTTTATLGILCFTTGTKVNPVTTTPGGTPASTFYTLWTAELGDDDLSIELKWATREQSTAQVYLYRNVDGATRIDGPFGPASNFSHRISSIVASQTYQVWIVSKDGPGTKYESSKKSITIPGL